MRMSLLFASFMVGVLAYAYLVPVLPAVTSPVSNSASVSSAIDAVNPEMDIVVVPEKAQDLDIKFLQDSFDAAVPLFGQFSVPELHKEFYDSKRVVPFPEDENMTFDVSFLKYNFSGHDLDSGTKIEPRFMHHIEAYFLVQERRYSTEEKELVAQVSNITVENNRMVQFSLAKEFQYRCWKPAFDCSLPVFDDHRSFDHVVSVQSIARRETNMIRLRFKTPDDSRFQVDGVVERDLPPDMCLLIPLTETDGDKNDRYYCVISRRN